MKTVTLKQVGYLITGVADLTLWDGTAGCIEMKPFKTATKEKAEIEGGLNDNGFGCQRINGAICDVWILYENDYKEIDSTIDIGKVAKFTGEVYERGY